MTEDAIKSFIKALALLSVAVGGFGSILCIPFAVTTDLRLIATAGVYFVAGGVMIVGGLITLSLMTRTQTQIAK